MTELKNPIFPLEQENAFHVYQGEELYVATKWWQQNIFTSQQTNQIFNIFFKLTCNGELCKIQYVEKAETKFNLRSTNDRKDTKKRTSILGCKYFHQKGHNFNKYAKFIIIDHLLNLHGSKESLWEMLVILENFWIQNLKTQLPFGLNQELRK